MTTWVWIVIAICVIAVVGVIVVGAMQQRRRRRLQQTFGPEYQRTVDRRGDRREAERELHGRYERRQHLDIRPLTEERRQHYDREWRNVQARFVDAPHDAVQEGDTLVMAVMRERGYPVGDFEQRTADVSVDHADVVDEYRSAHEISQRSAAGRAGTEDLRQAMVHYRALFGRLLDSGVEDPATGRAR